MVRIKPTFAAILVVAATAVVLHERFAPPGQRLAQLADLKAFPDLVLVWTLTAAPILALVPRVRAMPTWSLPSETYFLPLAQVCAWLASFVGVALGFMILATLENSRLFWLAASFLTISITFWLGASGRFRHPEREYHFPRFRWLLRKLGYRLRTLTDD